MPQFTRTEIYYCSILSLDSHGSGLHRNVFKFYYERLQGLTVNEVNILPQLQTEYGSFIFLVKMKEPYSVWIELELKLGGVFHLNNEMELAMPANN